MVIKNNYFVFKDSKNILFKLEVMLYYLDYFLKEYYKMKISKMVFAIKKKS